MKELVWVLNYKFQNKETVCLSQGLSIQGLNALESVSCKLGVNVHDSVALMSVLLCITFLSEANLLLPECCRHVK